MTRLIYFLYQLDTLQFTFIFEIPKLHIFEYIYFYDSTDVLGLILTQNQKLLFLSIHSGYK